MEAKTMACNMQQVMSQQQVTVAGFTALFIIQLKQPSWADTSNAATGCQEAARKQLMWVIQLATASSSTHNGWSHALKLHLKHVKLSHLRLSQTARAALQFLLRLLLDVIST